MQQASQRLISLASARYTPPALEELPASLKASPALAMLQACRLELAAFDAAEPAGLPRILPVPACALSPAPLSSLLIFAQAPAAGQSLIREERVEAFPGHIACQIPALGKISVLLAQCPKLAQSLATQDTPHTHRCQG